MMVIHRHNNNDDNNICKWAFMFTVYFQKMFAVLKHMIIKCGV